jgi:hypothetical protein
MLAVACRPYELIESHSGTPTRQIDGPYVVKRHASQKRMNPQRQSFELLI